MKAHLTHCPSLPREERDPDSTVVPQWRRVASAPDRMWRESGKRRGVSTITGIGAQRRVQAMVDEEVTGPAAADPNKRKTRGFDPALAFGLGALSFAGWLSAALLDAKVFPHNAVGSFFVHLPLMLLPAALVLAFGLKRLPDNERTTARMVGAWTLVVVLTVPALIPELNHHPLWLPLRLPIYGLGLALALGDPGMRIGLDQQGSRRFSPATVASAAFGVCGIITAFVALSLSRYLSRNQPAADCPAERSRDSLRWRSAQGRCGRRSSPCLARRSGTESAR